MDCQLCETCPFISGTDKVYYEIHITVKYDASFITYCKSNNIKVIDIYLGEGVPNQLMTSITESFDSYSACIKYVKDLFDLFTAKGYKVIRKKIETSPNNPIIALFNKEDIYFESHFAVTNPDDDLNFIGLHKSRNLLKKKDKHVQMLTYRHKGTTLDAFRLQVGHYEGMIREKGYNLDKVIIECCVLDSKEDLDAAWFSKKLWQNL